MQCPMRRDGLAAQGLQRFRADAGRAVVGARCGGAFRGVGVDAVRCFRLQWRQQVHDAEAVFQHSDAHRAPRVERLGHQVVVGHVQERGGEFPEDVTTCTPIEPPSLTGLRITGRPKAFGSGRLRLRRRLSGQRWSRSEHVRLQLRRELCHGVCAWRPRKPGPRARVVDVQGLQQSLQPPVFRSTAGDGEEDCRHAFKPSQQVPSGICEVEDSGFDAHARQGFGHSGAGKQGAVTLSRPSTRDHGYDRGEFGRIEGWICTVVSWPCRLLGGAVDGFTITVIRASDPGQVPCLARADMRRTE